MVQLSLPNVPFGTFFPLSDDLPFQGANDGRPDSRLVYSKFPIEPTRAGEGTLAYSKPFCTRYDEQPLVRYSSVSLSVFDQNPIRELPRIFRTLPDHWGRVDRIIEKLNAGGTWFPPFFQFGDPFFRILEGNHRCVAFLELFPAAQSIPVFHVGYADWFDNLPNRFASREYLSTVWPFETEEAFSES